MVSLVDLNQSVASAVSTPSNASVDHSSVKKELSDLKDDWSTRFAHIEALLAMGSNPLSAQPVSAVENIAPVFFPVKVKFSHPAPAGVNQCWNLRHQWTFNSQKLPVTGPA